MNDSGSSVGGAVRFYKVPLASLLVVHDEGDFDLGRLQLAPRRRPCRPQRSSLDRAAARVAGVPPPAHRRRPPWPRRPPSPRRLRPRRLRALRRRGGARRACCRRRRRSLVATASSRRSAASTEAPHLAQTRHIASPIRARFLNRVAPEGGRAAGPASAWPLGPCRLRAIGYSRPPMGGARHPRSGPRVRDPAARAGGGAAARCGCHRRAGPASHTRELLPLRARGDVGAGTTTRRRRRPSSRARHADDVPRRPAGPA